jgi:glutathione S-transferase
MNFLEIEKLKNCPGLRVVVVRGVPSPWGQAAKAMMEFKGLDYAAGLQIPAAANEELVVWAGVNSGPVVAWENEPPLNNWLDILNLLERLAPDKPMRPSNPAERALCVGLSNEICGVLGLGWNRRISLYRPALDSANPPTRALHMGGKYGYNDADAASAVGRQVGALKMLDEQLRSQQMLGSRFFVGQELSAVDIYWASFSTIFELPPAERVPVAAERRPMFEQIEPDVRAALTPRLMAHREEIMSEFFRSPMEF